MSSPDPHAGLTTYLLGDLDSAGAVEFEAHLEACAACRADVAELRPLVAAARASLPSPTAPPPRLAEEVLERLEVEAGGSRPQPAPRTRGSARRAAVPPRSALLAGAALTILIVGLFVALSGGGEGGEQLEAPPAPAPALRAQMTGSGGSATIEIDETGSGLEIAIASEELPAPPDGGFYEIWFVGAGERLPERPLRVSAGTFLPDDEGRTAATGVAAVAPENASRIEVTLERDRIPAASGDVVLGLDVQDLIRLG